MLTRKLTAFFLDTLEVIVFSIAIFLLVYLLVLQPHKIKGQSMEPNFDDGEYLLTDKITYRVREPQRGDVIVFEAPSSPDEEFIKRIIATPGEKVELVNGKVMINDKLLVESYLPIDTLTNGSNFLREGQQITVPNDNYFVLGDNRGASSDSRTWGFVPKKAISGRAWVVYWPPSRTGVVDQVHYNYYQTYVTMLSPINVLSKEVY